MNQIIIVCGPTAVGKTATSIKLAQKFNTEIISSDSMQIYKYMEIGTAKIKKEDMQGIKHHMIDIINPDEEFSVSDYYEKSIDIVKKMFLEDKIPIIVGGTGLYINSLIYKMDFNNTASNPNIREKYQKIYEEYGVDYLYNILLEKDEAQARKIDKNNIKRVIRAIEITQNNDFMKSFEKANTFQDYKINMYVLYLDRKILYDRINRRVDAMIKDKLIEEVRYFLEKGITISNQSMKAIGYRQIISYLNNEIDKNEAIELIKRDSRRYAKRQYTWFKRYDFAKWIDVENMQIDDIVQFIEDDMYRKISLKKD